MGWRIFELAPFLTTFLRALTILSELAAGQKGSMPISAPKHSLPTPRYGQCLTPAHSHFTRAVAAMDSASGSHVVAAMDSASGSHGRK